MLASILNDLDRIHEVESLTTLIDPLDGPAIEELPARIRVEFPETPSPAKRENRLLALLAESTHHLIIAPEIGGRLSELSRLATTGSSVSLGCEIGAIEAASDKLETARLLEVAGLPTPPRTPLDEIDTSFPLDGPLVIQPRRGAGSWATRRVDGAEELAALRARPGLPAHEWIASPHCPGLPASVTLLVGAREIHALPARRQRLEFLDDGRLHEEGFPVPLEDDELAARATRLARAAVETIIPGLRGFVGVDLILGDHPGGDRILEINPRLTTSHPGLVSELGPGFLARRWLEGLEALPVTGSVPP